LKFGEPVIGSETCCLASLLPASGAALRHRSYDQGTEDLVSEVFSQRTSIPVFLNR